MKKIACLPALIISINLFAQEVNIIPNPKEIISVNGKFQLTASTVLLVKNKVDENAAGFFNNYLKYYFGFRLKKVKDAVSNYIQPSTIQSLLPGKEGAYSLVVSAKNILIQGQTASGTFYGIQTLIQLLPVQQQKSFHPVYSINAVQITDYPRFTYRGMHLDVSRHFFPVSFIKKYIDYLALHKLNTFHWHLTEDQGWRIEIKKYPELTKVGAWRNGTLIGRYPGKGNDNKKYGGFYTQQQIKEIVKYAAARYITVIPEIELPGHGSAAIAAYPQLSCFPDEKTVIPENMISKTSVLEQQNGRKKLVQETWGVFDDVFCAGKDSTFKFLQDVMDEVLTLFPSKYIHIGGDESPKTSWKRCPLCQSRIKSENLKDEHDLQSYFIQRTEKYLNSKGRNIIGWDEILEGGLAPNATVMSWRGEQGGIDAAKQNHDVIMTPGNPVYFDYSQTENEDSITIGGYNSIEKVYAYDPVPKELSEEQAKHILGAQANMWTEYIKNTSKAEYMLFPRMAALSEVLWTAKEKKNWNDFENRLMTQFKRYDLWKVNYSKAYFDLKATILPTEDYNGVLWKLETKMKNPTIKYRDANDADGIGVSDFFDYQSPIKIQKSIRYEVINGEINKQTGNSLFQNFRFNKATGKKIILTTSPSPNYPGDGAFTLVNGVQNEKGLARSKEFLGFSGTNCEATIDFGADSSINEIIIHTLEQAGSWIYFPSAFDISKSADGINFSPLNTAVSISKSPDKTKATIKLANSITARYFKINIMNLGTIPAGNPGEGTKAWLFVDEIEVN